MSLIIERMTIKKRIVRWFRIRKITRNSPIFTHCWKVVRSSEEFSAIRKTDWSLNNVEEIVPGDYIERFSSFVDMSSGRNVEIMKIFSSIERCLKFTILTDDRVGLDKYPLAQGKAYSFFVDMSMRRVIHVAESCWFI